MIKNFDELKKQLAELVEVVNGFKSEQVQLRVVEAVLASMGVRAPVITPPEADDDAPPASAKKKSKKTRAKNTGNNPAPAKATGTRKSPKTAIVGLIAEGYFAQHRGIGVVVSHLAEKKATTLSQQAVQMALNRFVQNGEMERGKNGEGQFEYWK